MMLCRLLEDLDCTLVQGRSDIEVNAICCDSRSVTPGCVFVCLPGQHTDGRRFAHAAAAAGAAVLVFEGTLPNFEFSRSCSPALVQAEPGKARRVLALMASRLYGYPARRMTMIGITGTKGKTTTAHLLAAVLTAAGRRVGCIGTNGAVWPGQRHTLGYTTPESCDLQHILRDMADDGCDTCVMEVSSLGLKMDRVGGIAFDVGVFTNLSPDHIGPGEHASYAEYRAWKSVLFRRCKVGVVNADDRETPAVFAGDDLFEIRVSRERFFHAEAIEANQARNPLADSVYALEVRSGLGIICRIQIVEADFALEDEASDIRDIAGAVSEAEALEPFRGVAQDVGAGKRSVNAERAAAQVADGCTHSRNRGAGLFDAHSLAYHEGYDRLP